MTGFVTFGKATEASRLRAGREPEPPRMNDRHDYSDRLNPFLVKELRAGLRAHGYITMFLLLVAALTTHAVVTVDSPGAARFSGPIFTTIVYVILVLIMPLSSLGALGAERSGRKLEPLILSPLTARDVVYGKWLVVAIQSVVMASLTAPFIVLQYFGGGVNVVSELAHIVIMLSTGLVFSAVTLVASGLMREGNPVLNVIVRIVTVFGLLYAGGAAVGMTLVLSMSGGMEMWVVALIAPFGAAFCVAVMLEIAGLTLGANFGSALSSRKSSVTSQ
jgi:ABC-type transport system involved in multi-copper enzyme maturation permease subunit